MDASTGRPSRTRRAFGILALVIASASLAGCVERHLLISTDPPGANVIIDGIPVTRPADLPGAAPVLAETPVEVEFTYDGVREVVLLKDGYHPQILHVDIEDPALDLPPFDIIAALLPVTVQDRHEVSATLSEETAGAAWAADPETYRNAILGRAMEMRRRVAAPVKPWPEPPAGSRHLRYR